MFCSLLSNFFFVGESFSADNFKDGIITPLKGKERVQFFLFSVAPNHAIEKGKPL